MRAPGVGRLVAAACLLGAVTVGDGFVFLMLQQRSGLTLGWFPLLAVGTALVYLAMATPMGVLADRIGRGKVLLCGYLALTGVYLSLSGMLGGWPLIMTVVVLYGLFYATTDGVLMALAGPVLPEHLRTTGVAVIQSGQALAYLVSSVLFGFAWTWFSATTACVWAACAVVVAVVATTALLKIRAGSRTTDPEGTPG
jgi:MFS family permease